MSSLLNVDLDFLDYTPTSKQDQAQSSEHTAQLQDGPGVQIRIPEVPTQPPVSSQKLAPSSTSGNLFQNLIGNATGLGSQSGMSDEALRQIMWAANRQRQSQRKSNKSSGNFNWALNYLSHFFDVTTMDVIERIVWSAVPIRKTGLDIDNLNDTEELMAPLSGGSPDPQNSDGTDSYAPNNQRLYSYMERFIQSRPDFYGPFWVSATLVFVIAIFSNIASFANGSESETWHYSMDEMNMSCSLVMLFVTMMPTFLWFCLWFRGCSKFYTLTETICAYGYSLSIFVPLAVMLTVQNILFRYFMITLAAASSGIVLLLSFLPIAKSDPNPASSHIILAIIPFCQFGLAYIIHRIMLQ